MGAYRTAFGIVTQPVSVPSVWYFSNVEPKDPKDYLWKNIAQRAGVPAGKTSAVFTKLASEDAPRGNLQRIEESGRTTTETLFGLAKAMQCEVWELLVPPGAEVANAPPTPINIDQAIDMVALALGGVAKADREALFKVLEKYADDPANRLDALNYVRKELGGALNQPDQLRQAGWPNVARLKFTS